MDLLAFSWLVIYVPIHRDERSYQRPLSAEEIGAMCRRVLVAPREPVLVEEIGTGTYNNTYRVDLDDGRSVILRVAPSSGLQFQSEREFMRNEHAAVPFFAPIANLLPRTLGIDFTHEVVNRDYLVQSRLDGEPAPVGLERFPRAQWTTFFEDLGRIARAIHDVRGDAFGFVAGPAFDTWSAALQGSLSDLIADHERAGLEDGDVRELSDLVLRHEGVLDQIRAPRLLHGDLWTVNVMIDADAPEPRVTGVCDWDRASWGDPLADWSIFVARKRPGTERDAFWTTYGTPPSSPESEVRSAIYEARHVVMARLERYRLGRTEEVRDSYLEVATALERIDR